MLPEGHGIPHVLGDPLGEKSPDDDKDKDGDNPLQQNHEEVICLLQPPCKLGHIVFFQILRNEGRRLRRVSIVDLIVVVFHRETDLTGAHIDFHRIDLSILDPLFELAVNHVLNAR